MKNIINKLAKKKWEGVIAKKIDSIYVPGNRSKFWLKFKCSASQELIIIGYKLYKNSNDKIGALILGYYDGNKLKYAGKVGTGFDTKTRKTLHQKLSKITVDKCLCDISQRLTKDAQWVKPKYVAEIGFTEWTRMNRLRHPRYKGLRYDKPAKKVVKEDVR